MRKLFAAAIALGLLASFGLTAPAADVEEGFDTLFNGQDLTGWRLVEQGSANGWGVEDGVLINRPVQEEGKPHKNYGNLRTDREFEDFNLTLEVSVPKRGNSGIYLRGIYEIQVADSYGRPTDSHNMGGLYSRITPTVNVCKPTGE